MGATAFRHARGQRGLSMIGFLFTAAVIVAIAMVGFRVTPSYVEYFAVKRAMQETLDNMRDVNSKAEFRRGIEGRLNVNYVDAVNGSDIEVKRQGNVVTATATWDRKLHVVGNAYILLEFEAEAAR
jgi:hypothetical protein